MDWVVDCSFTAALFLPDEGTEKVRNFFSNSRGGDVYHVPALWSYEVSNVLLSAVRRKRLTKKQAFDVILLFKSFNFKKSFDFDGLRFKEAFLLAEKYKLSAYDACYLELALSIKVGLASLDADLIKAASDAGIRVY